MKKFNMGDKVATLHGVGKISAIQTDKDGSVEYGVVHDRLLFNLPKGYKQNDIVYYLAAEVQYVD